MGPDAEEPIVGPHERPEWAARLGQSRVGGLEPRHLPGARIPHERLEPPRQEQPLA